MDKTQLMDGLYYYARPISGLSAVTLTVQVPEQDIIRRDIRHDHDLPLIDILNSNKLRCQFSLIGSSVRRLGVSLSKLDVEFCLFLASEMGTKHTLIFNCLHIYKFVLAFANVVIVSEWVP